MLEQYGVDVTHQHIFLSLVLDRLDGIHHTHILTHLECCLSMLELNESEALLTKTFKERHAVPQTHFRHLYAV